MIVAERALLKPIEAERALLGTLLLKPEKKDYVINSVNTNNFNDSKHRYIFEAMKQLKMQNREIDYVTVGSVLDNNLYKIGGIDYLIELVEATPASEYLETYIDLIKENALKRDVLGLFKQFPIGLSGTKNIHNYLQAVKNQLESFMQKTKSPFISTKTLSPCICQSILNDDEDNQFVGIQTGFKNLDELISGFKPNQLIILGARTAMGKTTFMLNLACNIAKNFTSNNKNQKAVIFSLEMAAEELVIRLLSSASQIPLKQLQHKNLNKDEKSQLLIADNEITRLNILIDDDRDNKIEDIETKCRQMKSTEGLDIVFIDYLHLLIDDQNLNIYQAISKISRALKKLASELNIPIMALSQTNRANNLREDKTPQLTDLSGSGTIEQDADVVMFLHRESYYKKPDIDPHTNLIIAKNRSGEVGECSFNFYKQIQRFEEKE
ncbi:replicative DNA helicase [Candidatus Phytoplasma australiense]|uniref:DNA 5'-3' helicase n=1 Tax=Strawberry lethal yellows phytoplasma (CPA) str. NZSb11 TaxID=980422 RepID=R4RQW3_PHYAS|nr:replicative DNA helicase [Candidatus Phytoplasma australiense]AGL90896.1 Replicative DNA helicase [Strawberry lethal yellows phytoplasma (CPA) str. NZSb11]